MRKLLLTAALVALTTAARCGGEAEVICFREVVLVDSASQEPIVDEPLYRVMVECEVERDTTA